MNLRACEKKVVTTELMPDENTTLHEILRLVKRHCIDSDCSVCAYQFMNPRGNSTCSFCIDTTSDSSNEWDDEKIKRFSDALTKLYKDTLL